MLQSVGLQRVGHDWENEQQQAEEKIELGGPEELQVLKDLAL